MCDKASALKFMLSALNRHGNSQVVATDRCHSCRAAMKEIGSAGHQERGPHLINRVENSRLLFRRRERAMSHVQQMRSL
ncbi:MAG: DDE-type integrase/transposase/recombinase [Hyphomonas sp.]